jgi:hypothetical protein
MVVQLGLRPTHLGLMQVIVANGSQLSCTRMCTGATPRLLCKQQSRNIIIPHGATTFTYTGRGRKHV